MVNLLRDFYFSCSGVDLTLIAVLVITLRTMGAIGQLSACCSFNDSHWSHAGSWSAPQAFNRPQHNIRMSEHTLMTDVN